MQVEFVFSPRQKVRIVAYGLHYEGMILWCEYSNDNIYMVEWASDGKIQNQRFYENQLEGI